LSGTALPWWNTATQTEAKLIDTRPSLTLLNGFRALQLLLLLGKK